MARAKRQPVEAVFYAPPQYTDIHQGKLTPWQPGDPVGTGQVYLPSEKLAAAYGAECQRLLVESWAQQVMKGQTIHARRALIQQCPASMREKVKLRVTELWEQNK